METDIEYLKDYITLLTADTRPLELKETGQKELAKAIETVLNALENSISKDKIRKYIETLEDKLKEYKVNMGGKEYIVMSYLDKEEKELVHNIMIQIATLKDLLEEE